ncbi:hypothetical protein ABZ851_37135 [Streptomyces sp. NPDC047049]|uniref:hypothetical protein n=1 Tax=Streptomyces sp. NPDC047049 TaxID=3156688 RepID=UPI0033C5C16D
MAEPPRCGVSGVQADLPPLFTRTVDGRPVDFVQPADTEQPVWYAYEAGQPLGAVHADVLDGATAWVVEMTSARHEDLEEAVRALRRSDPAGPGRNR